ncbi:MAG: type II toxin-antitoxin system ParD family antitoxin [Bdellovibrionales bacterium]
MDKDSEIKLSPHYAQFISQQIMQGRFHSTSEAVQAGLRLLEQEETKLAAIRQALKESEESGISDYSLEKIMEELDRGQFR